MCERLVAAVQGERFPPVGTVRRPLPGPPMAAPRRSTTERTRPCAASSATSAIAPCRSCCWTGSRSSSTAATTRPGSRSSPATQIDSVRVGGQPREPAPCRRRRAGRRRRRRRRRAHRHDRHRPHPLGHPRARQRGQRPPALRHGRSRPRRRQRHRRELHGAQAPPDRHGRGLHVRDGRGGHRSPHRPPLRGGQPRRGRPRGLRRARGPLRVRRDVARGARRPGRRAQGVPADRRSRRGRDLPGLRHPRLPPRDASRPVHRERRDRRRAARLARRS